MAQGLQDLFLEPRLPPGDDGAGDVRLVGPGDGPDAGLVGNDQGEDPAVEVPTPLGVDESLEVGAAAGDQHGDPGRQHRTTRSSPMTISPMR